MVPSIEASSFNQSIDDRNVLYAMRMDPQEDFDLVQKDGTKLRMTVTQHFVDCGAPAVDYRPAEWSANMNLRVRFYWWGFERVSCGKCSTCSCKSTKRSEDAGV